MKIIRGCMPLFALTIMLLSAAHLRADTTVANTNSGWIMSDGSVQANNTTYSSGFMYGFQFDNYFNFNLGGVSGTVTGATFEVESYNIVGTGTYSIYSTGLTNAEAVSGGVPNYNALTSGTLIGSISIDPSDDSKLLDISLNSGGLAWLQANEGNQIVLGGAFIAPGSLNYAFGQSLLNSNNVLDIQTVNAAPSATPEPSSVLLLGSGLFGIAGLLRRRLMAA